MSVAPTASSAPFPGDRLPVAIVGGGYSGTVLAAELARRGMPAYLIDGSGRMARGAAYSTDDPAHLLNVPAGKMSAFADDPEHFCRFRGAQADEFAQRRIYGDYLAAILGEAVASGLIRPVHGQATEAQRGNGAWRIGLGDGATLNAAALVLATGNEAPGGLAALAGTGARYVANPWGEQAREAIRDAADTGGDVLILGTGLTMVDTVLSLDQAGFGGRILAISRRGQMPRVHAPHDPAPVDANELPHGSLMALWQWLRRRSAKVGWRAAVDGLRPHSQGLWQALPLADRKRFLRHARAHWDVRRHRIAPAVGERIAALIAEGRLEIAAARVESANDEGAAIGVSIRRRGAGAGQQRRFDHVINCTGPLHVLSATRDPLLRALLDRGEVQPDALDIGLALDSGARVAGARRLWAMAGLTKGHYWEITAVPDIRGQAAAIAAQMAEELVYERC